MKRSIMTRSVAPAMPWLKKVTIGCLLTAGLAILLWKTNPSHLKHHQQIWPGPAPVELMDLSRLKQADIDFIKSRDPELAKTAYKSFGFCSTTSNKHNGSHSSFGILGSVFDLRTGQQAMSEQAYEADVFCEHVTDGLINNMNRTTELIDGVRNINRPELFPQNPIQSAGQRP